VIPVPDVVAGVGAPGPHVVAGIDDAGLSCRDQRPSLTWPS